MNKLFSHIDFKKATSKDNLPLKCYNCNKIFYASKHKIQTILNSKTTDIGYFCSVECKNKNQITSVELECKNCNKKIKKQLCEIKNTKNSFCSQSCACTYNNKNKKYGNRRSRLEKYLESELTILYPNLKINFNKKDAINSELDIYIPSLKLAFELNGIFHYEPIFGKEKLSKIKNNDKRKFQACIENKIELCIIDSSKLTYFKAKSAEKFLNIITKIINKKFFISGEDGV